MGCAVLWGQAFLACWSWQFCHGTETKCGVYQYGVSIPLVLKVGSGDPQDPGVLEGVPAK